MMRFLLIATFLVVASAANTKMRYDGYKVYRLNPTTRRQNDLLKQLGSVLNLDFWAGINPIGNPVDVMVEPKNQEAFLLAMSAYGIPTKVQIENVQDLIDAEVIGDYASTGMTWTAYFNLEDINAWLEKMETAYPGKVSVINGGSTYEKRAIKGIKISFNAGKRAVFIEGGIHAREWISSATVTYLANELLTSTDPTFMKIAESFDWYIFPVTNPDGFAYTHSSTRLWRKTRTPYGACFGADPNRNWDDHWGEQGASNNSCDNRYAGPKPFSETCTSTLSNYIRTIGSSIDVYLDFHSYGQLLMVPYGYTPQHLDNYNETIAIGEKAIAALAKRYGTSYKVGNVAETIYPASGGSIDWVKSVFKTPIVFVYELRDTGTYGFILPANQIIANGMEVVDSIVGMFLESEARGYFKLE